MKPIDLRPRVRQIIEEPQQVNRILIPYRQHGESFRVESDVTRKILPQNPLPRQPILPKVALALSLDVS